MPDLQQRKEVTEENPGEQVNVDHNLPRSVLSSVVVGWDRAPSGTDAQRWLARSALDRRINDCRKWEL